MCKQRLLYETSCNKQILLEKYFETVLFEKIQFLFLQKSLATNLKVQRKSMDNGNVQYIELCSIQLYQYVMYLICWEI